MTDAPTRWPRLAVLCILIVGAVLRFTALGHGIPYALGIDEPEIMERAVRMMKTGELHPHFFDYPGLYIYLQFLVACIRFVAGSIAGLWANLNEAAPADFYLWARAVTAVFGTATIGLVYWVGRRISPLAGVLAAALFAVQSMHIRESHFVLTDVPMTFFVVLAWYLTLRAPDRPGLRGWLLAGMAVGAAAATKYNGGVAILLPMLALAMSNAPWRQRVGALVTTTLAAGVTFLVCAPYTVLALPEFLNAFAYLANMYADGPPRPEPAWLTYAKHLRINFSIPAILCAVGGLLLTARAVLTRPRASETATLLLSAVFALVYYGMVSTQRLVWGRYLLPLLPFLCVLAGTTAAWLAERASERWTSRAVMPTAALALLAVLATVPASNAVSWLAMVSKTSTNKLAYDWIVEHIPEGARIVTETREVLLPETRYTIGYPRMLIQHDAEFYEQERIDYLLASSLSFHNALYADPPDVVASSRYRELFRRTEHVMTFMPSADHPGPELRIYRVRQPE